MCTKTKKVKVKSLELFLGEFSCATLPRIQKRLQATKKNDRILILAPCLYAKQTNLSVKNKLRSCSGLVPSLPKT